MHINVRREHFDCRAVVNTASLAHVNIIHTKGTDQVKVC